MSASASLSNYYKSSYKDEFRSGHLNDIELIALIKKSSLKNFKPLGYKKNTKKFLFGAVDLKQDDQGYYIFDVYCHKIIRNSQGNTVGPYKVPKNEIMNTEHTWPQSKGARKEPARGDLHHLFPTDSRANSSRGNYQFAEVRGGSVYRGCEASKRGVAIDPQTGKATRVKSFQPPVRHRGNVARAMFYVSARYNYHLPPTEEFYLKKWNKEDPVDQAEKDRNDAIESAQGNRNPFIDFPKLVDRISDF